MSSKILLLVISLFLCEVWAYSSFRIAPNVYINQPNENSPSSMAVVNGFRSCGGHGKLIQFRYEPCSESGPADICQVPGDGRVRKSELEFIPSRDVGELGIQFLVITDDAITTSYINTIEESGVIGGKRFVSNALIGANQNIQGTRSKVQYMIYRLEDDNVEVCAEMDFQIV